MRSDASVPREPVDSRTLFTRHLSRWWAWTLEFQKANGRLVGAFILSHMQGKCATRMISECDTGKAIDLTRLSEELQTRGFRICKTSKRERRTLRDIPSQNPGQLTTSEPDFPPISKDGSCCMSPVDEAACRDSQSSR